MNRMLVCCFSMVFSSFVAFFLFKVWFCAHPAAKPIRQIIDETASFLLVISRHPLNRLEFRLQAVDPDHQAWPPEGGTPNSFIHVPNAAVTSSVSIYSVSSQSLPSAMRQTQQYVLLYGAPALVVTRPRHSTTT